MIAQVVFNLPVNKAFDYLVPSDWGARLKPGMRVAAPFGKRRLVGAVIRLQPASRIPHLKTLLRVLDPRPVLEPEAFRLAHWLAGYYGCSVGEACATIVPSSLRLRAQRAQDESPAATRVSPAAAPALTAQQTQAMAHLEAALHRGRPATVLLHGVTGSGKTELYLRTIASALKAGRSAIVLVPEIALTPQTIDRFRERFGDEVVLWHSRLSARQRSTQWQHLLEGRSRIVVGTRSAVFAPIKSGRLGVIVLDEEHDPSYKQDQSPRYHAREVAIARARMSRAVVILGSATPSVESYHEATRGGFALLELTERVQGRPLPRVEVVDMRQEWARQRRAGLFSTRLALALRQVVDLKEQAILLLNRRGFARVVQCQTCGAAIRCSQCAVPLIYHASVRQLVCHYCNTRQAIPETCPACHRGYLRLRGSGTERIESELHRLFPASGIGRMDTDTTRSRDSHRRLYDAIKTRELDLLVGTQMVAKGFDLPQVTLVGVVSADTALNLPDFRAGERTFDLLTQVAGRAGRGDRLGQVLIQTFCPQHYAIQAACRHDYQAFYRAEIAMRKRLKLPPFVHLIELTVQGSRAPKVQAAAEALKKAIIEAAPRPSRRDPSRRGSAASRGDGGHRIEILGPAPHRVARLRRTIRWHLVLKGRSVDSMMRVVRRAMGETRRLHGLPVSVDVDPL